MKVKANISKALWFIIICFNPLLYANHQPLDKLIESFTQKISNKNDLSLTTSLELGGSQIEEVSLFYSSHKPLELDQARELIAEMTTLFLEDLNKNAYLKPDLSPYPFTAKQVDITIFFRGEDGKYASLPKIAQISLQEGVVSYYKYQKGNFEVIHKESIENAIEQN